MNTTELRTEVAGLEKRRDELQQESESAQANLDVARAQLVEGAANVKAVTAAQSTQTALAQAVAALNTQIEQKHAEFVERQAEEERTAKVSRLVELAKIGRSSKEDYERAVIETNEALKVLVGGRISDARRTLITNRNEFINLVTELVGSSVILSYRRSHEDDQKLRADLSGLFDEVKARGVDDLTGVTVNWSGLGRTELDDDNYRSPDVAPYGGVIRDAIRVALNHRPREVEATTPAAA